MQENPEITGRQSVNSPSSFTDIADIINDSKEQELGQTEATQQADSSSKYLTHNNNDEKQKLGQQKSPEGRDNSPDRAQTLEKQGAIFPQSGSNNSSKVVFKTRSGSDTESQVSDDDKDKTVAIIEEPLIEQKLQNPTDPENKTEEQLSTKATSSRNLAINQIQPTGISVKPSDNTVSISLQEVSGTDAAQTAVSRNEEDEQLNIERQQNPAINRSSSQQSSGRQAIQGGAKAEQQDNPNNSPKGIFASCLDPIRAVIAKCFGK